jgi:hypothetical protein
VVTLSRVWIASPNYSGRGGSPVRLIILHTAEGALSYQSLGNYFASTASGVSSHVGIDDTPGTVGEYVARGQKAWTQGNANPYSVAAELCAFAAWTPADWSAHPQMLANTAAWVAEEAAAFGIPLVALSESQAQDGHSRGVCQHADLGAAGGGHWDCGPGFPMGQVIDMATGTTPTQGGAVEICSTPSGDGYWIVGSDGGVFTYGDAGFYGSLGDTALEAPIVGMAATPTGCGYWLLGQDGGVFTFGDAQFLGAPTGLVQ